MNGVFAGEFRRLRRSPAAVQEAGEVPAVPPAVPAEEENTLLRRTAVLPLPEPDLDNLEQETGYRDRRRVSLLE